MSTDVPPGGRAEYLDMGGGKPLPPARPPMSRSARRTTIIAGSVVVGLGLVGGATWAAMSFFGTGPQPAEALPASTIAYASIDLDPSGGQKIAAMRTLRKFPAFREEVGLGADDDVREWLFTEIAEDADCDVDYGVDVEPWLGNRMAVGAVDAGGDSPKPVIVLQVGDEAAADEGLAKLKDCGSGDLAWTIHDGWALLSETQPDVDKMADAAAQGTLADDEDFTRWTGEAGDPGIATFYVAPGAGEVIVRELGMLSDESGGPDVPEPLKDFKGLGATLRFDDGALELEAAGAGWTSTPSVLDSQRGDDVLSTLPEDTAVAIGVGFADGWFGDLVDELAASAGESPADLMAEMSRDTGLDLPADAEALAGESAALAIGSDFDVEEFFSSSDAPDVPIGLKVKGDPDDIAAALDRLRPNLGPIRTFVDSDAEGDVVVIGPDPGYRAQLLKDNGLGDTDVFRNVVKHADEATAVWFVNFDAGGWLDSMADGDPEVLDNLEPLQGLGASDWQDGDTSHGLLRVTTD